MFWKKAFARDKARLPDPDKLLDVSLGDVVRSLIEVRAKLVEVLRDTPDEVKQHLAGVMTSMTEMEHGAVRLVKRADDLTRYLATADPIPIRREIDKLVEKARGARDEGTRKQYESARAMREEQLRALSDIAAARERVMAHLARLVATFEAFPAQIVRMRALDAQVMDALSGRMTDELDLINGDMKAFDETLASLGESLKT
jgi:hypothetical protein